MVKWTSVRAREAEKTSKTMWNLTYGTPCRIFLVWAQTNLVAQFEIDMIFIFVSPCHCTECKTRYTTCAGRHVTASVAAHWHCNIGILATGGGRDSWSLLLFPSRLPEILMGSSNASLNLKHKSSLSHFPPIQLLDYCWYCWVEYLTFVDDVWKERIQLLWIIVEIWAREILKVSERWHIFCEFPMSD